MSLVKTPPSRAVLHDAQGYFYRDDTGSRVAIDQGLKDPNVNSYSTGDVKGVYEYAAATNDAQNYIIKPQKFITPVTGNDGNSLASLMTQLEQKGDGSWQATVNLNTNAATMTAGEKQDNAIVANKDTYVNQTEQNGYGSGRMTNMEFDTNGVLYVTYNNGVTLPMWQLCMYDFRKLPGPVPWKAATSTPPPWNPVTPCSAWPATTASVKCSATTSSSPTWT